MIPDPGTGDAERDGRLAAVYHAGAQQQPPERLDDAIRAAARRAVAAGPRRGADRLRRWTVPLSVAAVVVLSVTLVTMMREDGADQWVQEAPPQPRVQPPVAAVEVPAPPAAPAMAPPPAPAAQRATAPVGAAPAEPRQFAPRAEAPVPELRGQPLLEQRAADSGSRRGNVEADAVAGVRQDSVLRDATPRALLRSAPAPAVAAETATSGTGQSAAAGSPGPGAVSSAKSLPAKSAGALWQDLEGEPVTRWLDRLRELRRAGRVAEADRLAAEFRRRFPDAALPDDGR